MFSGKEYYYTNYYPYTQCSAVTGTASAQVQIQAQAQHR
jgi:hypothetical protein